jgi:superfamily I DNA/RNA helicase
MALSTQQENAINWVREAIVKDSRVALNLIARAGCGKTFTLIEIAKVLSTTLALTDEVYFGAYNTAIAKEIKEKLSAAGIDPKHINASTLHSAGFSAWRRVAKTVQVDDKKVVKIVDALKLKLQADMLSKTGDQRARYEAKLEAIEIYRMFVVKAVSLAKQRAFGFLCSFEDKSQWYALIDHFGLEDEIEEGNVDMDEVVNLCIYTFKTSVSMDRDTIDYDDMILAPLVHNVRMWPKRVVMIDEAQDTNPARRALAIKMLAPKNGIFIAVGDDRQAIYGFTGADSDSLDLIKSQLNSNVLPLNTTYRCPKAVVAYAQKWVADINAHETAPDGLVRDMDEAGFWNEQLEPTDAILCRNTKPLVTLAYTMLRKGTACRIEGREIGNGLIQLAQRWDRIKTLAALSNKLEDYLSKETQKWMAKGKEDKVAQVEDKVETLMVLIEKLASEGKTLVSDLVSQINSMFGDEDKRQVLTLCTGHRSKGREWNRVFWLQPELSPSKYAKKEHQLLQEENLQYVITTRAKRELILVSGRGKQAPQS